MKESQFVILSPCLNSSDLIPSDPVVFLFLVLVPHALEKQLIFLYSLFVDCLRFLSCLCACTVLSYLHLISVHGLSYIIFILFLRLYVLSHLISAHGLLFAINEHRDK